MKLEMFDLCRWIIKRSKELGATGVKARFSRNRSVEIKYRKKQPEIIKEAVTRGIDLDIYMDGKYTSQTTPDIRTNALEDFIKKACENTRYIEKDEYRYLPPPRFYKSKEKQDLQIFDKKFNTLTPEKRHEYARTIENACIEKGGERVISVEASLTDNSYEEFVINSNGFEGYEEATSLWATASMSAKDEGDRKPRATFWAGCRLLDDIPSLTGIGEEAAKRTLDLMGGKKIKTITLPIIIENRVVSRLLRGFVEGLYGRNIQQKQSFLADKKGKTVGSKLFTLIDDPLLIKGFGSRLYDGDGFTSKKRTMINEGNVNDFYLNWYYSRKLNEEPTTGSQSNIILPGGTSTLDELIRTMKKVIVITDFLGGNSNSTTGDFSVGIVGKLYENGEAVQSIAEMNIADNHLNFWNKLVDVGNDTWIYSSWQTPSLVFDKIVVSGV